MKLINISPLTQKRLERFRRSRVAFTSLCLLFTLFCVSLCSELICNAKPLVMRYQGELTFPFLQSQPSEAVQSAIKADDPTAVTTYVDYRSFVKKHLDKNAGDFACFAPIPYSPDEALDLAHLEKDKVVTITMLPEQPVGRFNLTRDYKIVRQDNCRQFFPGVNLYDEQTRIDDVLMLTPELRQKIEQRLRGEAHPEEVFNVSPNAQRAFQWDALTLVLPPTVGGEPLKSLRINLRVPGDLRFLAKSQYKFKRLMDENGELGAPTLVAFTSEPSEALRDKLQEWAEYAFSRDITIADNVSYIDAITGIAYTVLAGNNIRLPFPPTDDHIFGLDASGRDVLARILYATRIALLFGLSLAFTATILGMFIGAMQGYFAGKVDIVIQRCTELWATLPFLYVMVLMGQVFGKSFWLLLIIYGLFCWIGLSYYMRAEFLRLRNRPFVAAARCQGLGNARIIFRHILPNALTPIITLFPFLLVGAIGALVSLDFLGFGLPPLTPSWGELLSQAQANREAWWLILFPTAAIFVVMFLTVMVGEGVRNAFDPKPFSKLQ